MNCPGERTLEGVSVVIPCYNAAAYLHEAINSVLDQHYQGPLEILVGDDGSTDASRDIARSFGARVIVLEKPRGTVRGPSAARNRCLHAATYPLIAFLDADDKFLPGHLAGLADVLAARPEIGLAYDVAVGLSEDGKSSWRFPYASQRAPLTPDALLLDQCFAVNAVMVRKAALDRVGLFDEGLSFGEDHDLWLRLFETWPVAHIPECGSIYRFHANQATKHLALWQQAERVLARAVARYPYRPSTVRKRRAVLAYRMGTAARQACRPTAAAIWFAKAAFLDPPRALRELRRRAASFVRRMSSRTLAERSLKKGHS